VTRRWILADTETSGQTEPVKVCELALIEFDEELQVLDRKHSLIDPERKIEAAASGIHHIEDQHCEMAPTLQEYFALVEPGLLDGEVVLCAHNLVYDEVFLKPFIPNLVGRLCTLRLARRYLRDAENHKLPTLMYQYGLFKGKSHSADGDTETTLDLLRLILKVSGKTLQELLDVCWEPLLVDTMTFGKFRPDFGKPGAPLSEVVKDKGYLRWLRGLKDLDPDLRWSLEQAEKQLA
jgi:DNA polymerase III epsilon subunit-like protein